MRQIIADCWALDLPEEWRAERDEDTIIICDDDNISTIEITAMRKQAGQDVNGDELAEFASDLNQRNLPRHELALGDFDGFIYEYSDQGDWCRDWFLSFKDVFVLISYTCLLDDKTLDDAAVDVILDTLSYLPEAVAAEQNV